MNEAKTNVHTSYSTIMHTSFEDKTNRNSQVSNYAKVTPRRNLENLKLKTQS